MYKKRGFGLIEVLVALLIISLAVFGLSRLMLASFKSVNNIDIQQQSNLASQYILNKINSTVERNYDTITPQNYVENNYDSDKLVAIDCVNKLCNSLEQVSYDLYLWKTYLSSLGANQIKGIVCNDTVGNYGIPTLDNPNCSGNGDVVIKIVWYNSISNAESVVNRSSKYLILKVMNLAKVRLNSLVGKILKVDGWNNINANNLVINQDKIYYSMNDNSKSSIFKCNQFEACNTNPLLINQDINDLVLYNNKYTYTVNDDNHIYQCSNDGCSFTNKFLIPNASLNIMRIVDDLFYVVNTNNEVYIIKNLDDLSQNKFAGFIDYNAYLSKSSSIINSIYADVADHEKINSGIIYLGFSDGDVYIDNFNVDQYYSKFNHVITNTNANNFMQDVVSLEKYTNQHGSYLIALNKNIDNPNLAGLYYLNLDDINSGWRIACNVFIGGNVNSLVIKADNAYFFVVDTLSDNGLYQCDLSWIGY